MRVLEWDTLRRLLGLPDGMSNPSPEHLAQLAIEDPKRARLAGMALRFLTPREGPAALILAALDRGAVEPALGVELLGCAGHRSGYAAARTALFEDGPEEANAAGLAMFRILGEEAASDLMLALARAELREGREGAALGLAELGDGVYAELVIEAARLGRIRARLAARCVTKMPFDPVRWLELLVARPVSDRRLATEVVYLLLRRADTSARERLDALGELGRHAVRRCLDADDLYMLPDKCEVLAAWAAG